MLQAPDDAGETGRTATDLADARCFYHEEKQADQACDSCGRLICSLCHVEIAGEIRCPPCIENKRDKDDKLIKSNLRYDLLARYLLILPLFLAWPTVPFFALVVLFVVYRYGKKTCSLVYPVKRSFIITAVLSVLFLLMSVAGLIAFVGSMRGSLGG